MYFLFGSLKGLQRSRQSDQPANPNPKFVSP